MVIVEDAFSSDVFITQRARYRVQIWVFGVQIYIGYYTGSHSVRLDNLAILLIYLDYVGSSFVEDLDSAHALCTYKKYIALLLSSSNGNVFSRITYKTSINRMGLSLSSYKADARAHTRMHAHMHTLTQNCLP